METKRRALTPVVSGYRHIENDLRQRIAEEMWPIGSMLPGRETLAREYNVSVGTVQRAVNNLVLDGVLRADRRRGTFVAMSTASGAVAGPRAARKSIIAAVVQQGGGADDPMQRAIVSGMSRLLMEEGGEYHVVTFNTLLASFDMSAQVESEVLRKIEQESMAAVALWHAGGDETLPQIRRLIESGIPVVFVDRCPAQVPADSVLVDNYAGARDAVEHLIGLGHTRIGQLSTYERIGPIIDRDRGYRDALKAAGIEVDESLIRRTSYQNIRREMPALAAYFTEESDHPTALFAVQDGIAHAFISATEALGLNVPKDISVIGFDDLDRYSYRPPILSSVQQPFEEIGRVAAKLLLQRINEPSDAPRFYQQIVLPTRLVIRSTTRACVGG